MRMPHTALHRPDLAEEESRRPASISRGDIMTAWLGVLLINTAVMIATLFR